MDRTLIINKLQDAFPNLLAAYAFGSRIQGCSHSQSDLDLALLVPTYADRLLLWKVSNELANELGVDIDLLDFRAASTVMQFQILTSGERWWSKDSTADLYETFVLSEKIKLDEARKNLIDDIKKEGHIYTR